MTSNAKNILLLAGAVIAIGASALWIYWSEFKAPQHDVALHRRVGEVMAEENARVAGKSGKVVLIAIPTRGEPELKTQLEAFHAKLKTLGQYQVRDYEMDTKDQDKYSVGT